MGFLRFLISVILGTFLVKFRRLFPCMRDYEKFVADIHHSHTFHPLPIKSASSNFKADRNT